VGHDRPHPPAKPDAGRLDLASTPEPTPDPTGGQASWLLPAALVLTVAGLVCSTRRAAYVLWGGWLVTTALVFSYMQGIFHDYYTVALAPAIGALTGMGAATLWRRRADLYALLVLGGSVAVTAVWSYILLNRATDFHPWLRVAVLATGALGAAGILLAQQLGRALRLAAAAPALAAVLAGPVAYSLNTAATPHTGSIVTAGPAVAGSNGFGRRGFPAGGLLNATTPSAEVVAALRHNSGQYTWVAAAVGSNNASGYQLATELPVMAVFPASLTVGELRSTHTPSHTLVAVRPHVAVVPLEASTDHTWSYPRPWAWSRCWGRRAARCPQNGQV